MNADQKERFIRWQDYRVTQLSFAINLFLGFAIASLAFIINIKLEGKLDVALPIDAVLVLWAASAVIGCIATISKLLDYRYTTRKIIDGGIFNTFMAKYCGSVTWGCFWSQIISYAIGAYLFVAGVTNL